MNEVWPDEHYDWCHLTFLRLYYQMMAAPFLRGGGKGVPQGFYIQAEQLAKETEKYNDNHAVILRDEVETLVFFAKTSTQALYKFKDEELHKILDEYHTKVCAVYERTEKGRRNSR